MGFFICFNILESHLINLRGQDNHKNKKNDSEITIYLSMLHNTKLEVLNVLKQESYVYKQGSMVYWITQSPSRLKIVGSIPFLARHFFNIFFTKMRQTVKKNVIMRGCAY